MRTVCAPPRVTLSILVTAALIAAALTTAARAGARAEAQPTSTARAAGIERAGQAFLGWSTEPEAEPTTAASTTTAPTTTAPTTVPAATVAATRTPGIDVASWQGAVDWASYWSQGTKFAYIKATEGTGYQNEYFTQQYDGSYGVGMLRGGYHFALPDRSSGSAQADYFVDHGGGWSTDGRTLPGVLDVEYNPYGASCYGLSPAGMVAWIRDFTTRYQARTGRDAVIYTTTDWWTTCTGNTSAFAASNPLWIARYGTTVGTLPAGWSYYTFWQYTDTPVDQNWFNGDLAGLTRLATG